jgi:hypothetical protein
VADPVVLLDHRMWAANYYPGRVRDLCVEFTSLINMIANEMNCASKLLAPAELDVAPAPDPGEHAAAFRALLQLHPETWRQLPFVTGAASF